MNIFLNVVGCIQEKSETSKYCPIHCLVFISTCVDAILDFNFFLHLNKDLVE